MSIFVINNLHFRLCKFGLLILFFQSLYLRFTWGQMNNAIILVIALTFCLLFALSKPSAFTIKYNYLIPVVLFAMAQLYLIIDTSLFSLIKSIIHIIIIAFVMFLNNDYKKELLRYFTNGVAFVLFVSLFAWILFLIGIPLTHSKLYYPELGYKFDDYFFFLKSIHLYFPRFQSLFLEPGHLGMVTAFLLFANRFDIKRKEVMILLVATVFSFSLASYILTLFSAFVFIFLNFKRKLLVILISSVLVATGYLFFLNFNKGDNPVNHLIISRLETKSSNIIESNRFSNELKGYYQNLKGSNYIFGIGIKEYNKKEWEGGNAGYKVFVIQYGLLGTFLAFIFYFSIVLYNKSKLLIFLFIVYILCFIQAAYPLWLGLVLIFITSMPILNPCETNILYEKKQTN